MICDVTLTPDEAARMMRDAGIKIAANTVREGIAQGVFPFGHCVVLGKRNFFISQKKLLEYLLEYYGVKAEPLRSGEEAV